MLSTGFNNSFFNILHPSLALAFKLHLILYCILKILFAHKVNTNLSDK